MSSYVFGPPSGREGPYGGMGGQPQPFQTAAPVGPAGMTPMGGQFGGGMFGGRPSPTGYGDVFDGLAQTSGAGPTPRMGFGDMTALDWANTGAKVLGAGLEWWEAREARKQREREAREILEEERRQFDAQMAERQAGRDRFSTGFARALEAMYG